MSDEQNEELSMRDTMEQAIAQVEGDEANQEDHNVEETSEIEASEAQGATDGDPAPEGQEQGQQAAPEPGSIKAPTSWSPKHREQFANLPPEIQAQINKRETEINNFLNQGAESRKLGEQFTQALQPFQSIMAAEGAQNPVEAVTALMQTAATLKMGSPQQKAERIAQLIQHYGVDIATLDNTLAGNPQADPQQSQLEQMLEQKLAPVNQFMNNMQQSQQASIQQSQQEADNEVAQFEQTAEFIDDVRIEMANLLDSAARQGQQMSLKQAYDIACNANPEIRAVLQEREKNQRITGQQQTIDQKRMAAQSINGTAGGNMTGQQPTDLRSQLEQHWDDSLRS